jgi:hypothetical protein
MTSRSPSTSYAPACLSRRRESALRAERDAIEAEIDDTATCLKLVETIEAFMSRLTHRLEEMDIPDQARILQLRGVSGPPAEGNQAAAFPRIRQRCERPRFRSMTSISARASRALRCAESATAGGVAAPNELPAIGEAPYPRNAELRLDCC